MCYFYQARYPTNVNQYILQKLRTWSNLQTETWCNLSTALQHVNDSTQSITILSIFGILSKCLEMLRAAELRQYWIEFTAE